MRKRTGAPHPALRVGDIRARRPATAPLRAPLWRLEIGDEGQAAEAVRLALYENPAIDVVDDPAGLFHEAVPQEALVYTGSPGIAQALAFSLPRFFAPLSYRPLAFEIRPAEGTPSLLFGDLLEPGLGAPRGQVQLRWRGEALPVVQESTFATWRAGQGRAVIALGQGPRAEGLLRIEPQGLTAQQALVLEPGVEGPRLSLHDLAPRGEAGHLGPVLDPRQAAVTLEADPHYETFHAPLQAAEIDLRLIPDSQFSRLLTRPRPGIDLLEVLAVFLPAPGRVPGIEGLALRLNAQRRLMAHEARAENWRVVLTRDGERLVLRADGQRQDLPKGRALPGVALRLQAATELDPALSPRWLVLGAEGDEPLGWIPLRLHANPPEGSNMVRQSALRHARTIWYGPEDTSAAGAALHLDWLDQAVPMVLRDGKGGTRASGLASWALDVPEVAQAELRVEAAGGEDPGHLMLDRPRHASQRIEDGTRFRLGLLWVRLHRPLRRGG